MKILKKLFVIYRTIKGSLFGHTCRFYPTCSVYAEDAIDRHGASKGAWLAVRRVLRCNQFNPGGFDPVP